MKPVNVSDVNKGSVHAKGINWVECLKIRNSLDILVIQVYNFVRVWVRLGVRKW